MGWILGKDGKVCKEMSTKVHRTDFVVEVESVINSRPLTYVHDNTEGIMISYALCPSRKKDFCHSK